jgi:ADA HAT complex component 1
MDKAAIHRPLNVVDYPNLMNKLKRKQADSPEPPSPPRAHVTKKWKPATAEVKSTVLTNGNADCRQPVDEGKPVERSSDHFSTATSAPTVQSSAEAQPSREKILSSTAPQDRVAKPEPFPDSNLAAAMETTSLTDVQQAIEAEFNYAILLKHNELRLIEQELAKCQVALEQLRRCALIPYPGTEGPSQDVSGGVGPALQPPAGYTEPQYAAPWGVTDGPYTRHYAKWLISDPQFDPMPERILSQPSQSQSQSQSQAFYGYGEGRTTRGSFAEFGSTGKARTSRTSTGTLKLQALGENPAPAPKIDPLLHKRSTDGQWVRLFCAQCGHSNFSNTQGFLNHCRIKHNQVFKSHDQAAIACGVPVDVNEAGTPITSTEPASVAAVTPVSASFPPPAAPGSVHPLVRSNPPQWAPGVHRDFRNQSRDSARPPPPHNGNLPKDPSMPHLSSLLASKGFDGDFKAMAQTAREKLDLSSMDSLEEDSVSGTETPSGTGPPQQLVRVPTSNAPGSASKLSSTRPVSKGNATVPPRLSRLPSPVAVGVRDGAASHDLSVSPVELSPNAVESNPGLVSDHEDEDDEDGYDARSQTDIVMDDSIVVEDGSDVEGVRARTDSGSGLEGCFRKGEGSHKH